MGEGFQFSPGGFVPLPDGSTTATSEKVAPAGAALAAAQHSAIPEQQTLPGIQPGSVRRIATGQSVTIGPNASVTIGIDLTRPRALLKAARVRIKAIRAELRNHKKLERELAELERLIAAATGKPVAIVRSLEPHRRSAG